MSTDRIILIIYGLLLLAGGFMGLKSGSKISLIAGTASGILVLLGVYLSTSNAKLGYGLLTTTGGLLVIVFLMRLLKTAKFMPSGMLLALSAAAAVLSLMKLIQK